MPRRQVKRGGRKFQPEKPLIYVFCEGESEQAYAKFLKEGSKFLQLDPPTDLKNRTFF